VIRIIDVFHVTIRPEIPIEQQAVAMTIFVRAIVLEPSDESQHTVSVTLARPSGEVINLGPIFEGAFNSTVAGAPGGFNINLRFSIAPKELGVHYVSVLLDGTEITETAFTLLAATSEAQK
jgi:hypothetical protein